MTIKPDFQSLLDSLYSRPEVAKAALSREEGTFLYSLLRMIRPEVSVEIGTHRGVSALWMARALAENGAGHLYTIDPYMDSSPDESRALIEQAGLSAQVTFIQMPSVPQGGAWCREKKLEIDMLFVDGDHRFIPAVADVMEFWPLMRDGALLILHDSSAKSGWSGPDLIRRIFETKVDDGKKPGGGIGTVDFLMKSGPGLTLIQKKSPELPRLASRWRLALYRWKMRLRHH